MNIIETLEKEEMALVETKRRIPTFGPGDTLRVNVKVIEGARERVQAYEGVCIARAGRGFNESFTVRKISYGEGVERVFPLYSPWIDSITVVRRGRVRRAKLYYLRGLRGKAARIVERTDNRAKALKAEFKGFKRPKGNADDLKTVGKFKKLFGGNGATAGMSKVNVKTTPKGAQIAVNRRMLEKTSPVEFLLNPGNYIVDITLTGYKPVQKVITVEQGGSVVIDETLEPQ